MTSVNMAGDGDASPNPRPSMMERQNSVTMEYFLETSNLDASTTQLLRKYDKDGNGSFSKDEVVAIILDLRETMRANENLGNYNKLFKRLLIAACAFCVLLLASMFGLSYAVAALTAKTEVASDGSLVAAGSHNAVAVNSRAEIHIVPAVEENVYCITGDELDIMRLEITTGRNVVLDQTNTDGSETIIRLSGGTVTVDSDETCFTTSSGQVECAVPTSLCAGRGVGRRLSSDQRRRLGLPERRRLQGADDFCIACSQAKGTTSWNACYDKETGEAVLNQPWLTRDYGCGCLYDAFCGPGQECLGAPDDSGICT